MALRRLQFLFDRLDALIEVVHQVLLLGVLGGSLRFQFELLVGILNLLLKVHDLLLVLLNDFLAEVRSLGQLFLDLLVILQVLGQIGDHTLHLVILEHQVFRALRLIVKLSC